MSFSALPHLLQGTSLPVSFSQAEMIIKGDFVESKGMGDLNAYDGVSTWLECMSTLYEGGKHIAKKEAYGGQSAEIGATD